jgi:hypothetical protein
LLNDSSNLKNVLICGDSFGVTDPDYPEVHFSEKILNTTPPVFKLNNLAHGGDSNALITLQLMQGLQFKPDFVILLFTTTHRHETDNDISVYYPKDLNFDELNKFRHLRYSTGSKKKNIVDNNLVERWSAKFLSDDFEILKNYFLIHYCLQSLKEHKIPFCYSLGGMKYGIDYSSIVDKNFIKNNLIDYTDQLLKINLWNHNNNKERPYFHVDNDDVQTAFANECLYHLTNAKII